MRSLELNFNIHNFGDNSPLYKRGYSTLTQQILFTGDLIFLNISFLTAYVIRFKENPFISLHEHFLTLVIMGNLVWIVNVYLFNIYSISSVSNWETIIWNMIKSIVFHSLMISFYILSVKGFYYSRLFFGLNYIVLTMTILGWRATFFYYIRNMKKVDYDTRNVVIVGANNASFKIFNYFLNDNSQGYFVKAIFSDEIDKPESGKVTIYPEKMMYEYLCEQKIDELYCAYPLTEVKKIRDIMHYAENNMIRFRYVPDFRALLYKKVDIEFYGHVPVLSLRTEPLEKITNRLYKRIFDIIFSLIVIFLIMPIIVPVLALLIKCQSAGPVIFKQLRSGRNNQEFYCYKFRTMVVNQMADKAQATKFDSRITTIGRFLRKTNLDEFPQFFNVLNGDMSVIGPRPHMVKHTQEFKESVDKFMLRHYVKPGITGWAQVNGLRGITETPQKIIKRARYDVWYIENWSMLLDYKIVFMTVFNMLKGEKNAF